MKEFYFYNNIKGAPPEIMMALFGSKPRMIGWKYERIEDFDSFEITRKLTLYLWSYYRVFAYRK